MPILKVQDSYIINAPIDVNDLKTLIEMWLDQGDPHWGDFEKKLHELITDDDDSVVPADG